MYIMYVCMYIYMYIYIYVCVCMYMYVCVYIYTHRVLVRGSVGAVYWSGVRPCTGQGLRRGRGLVRGYTMYLSGAPKRGRVLVKGETVYWSGAP